VFITELYFFLAVENHNRTKEVKPWNFRVCCGIRYFREKHGELYKAVVASSFFWRENEQYQGISQAKIRSSSALRLSRQQKTLTES